MSIIINDIVAAHINDTLVPNRYNDICAICLNNRSNNPYMKLNCNHYFHRDCLNKLEKRECPLCKVNIITTTNTYDSYINNTNLYTSNKIVNVPLLINVLSENKYNFDDIIMIPDNYKTLPELIDITNNEKILIQTLLNKQLGKTFEPVPNNKVLLVTKYNTSMIYFCNILNISNGQYTLSESYIISRKCNIKTGNTFFYKRTTEFAIKYSNDDKIYELY
jgi:hypothetical protein